MLTLEKQATERWGVGFDFDGKLPADATISGGTGTVLDFDNASADVSATLLVSTTATIDGTVATRVTGGTKGRRYLLSCTVTLSTGDPADTLTESILIQVLDW
jgi:hypothetical protein